MSRRRPVTPIAAGVFFALAAVIASAAGITLLSPGGLMDWIWVGKSEQFRQMLSVGPAVGVAFLALAVLLMAAGYGMFARLRWGWWAAIGILAVNGLSDAIRVATGSAFEGWLGIGVSVLAIGWLCWPSVRKLFR